MSWGLIAQVVCDMLALALIVRLLALGLHSVYRVFCVFLVVEVIGTSLAIVQSAIGGLIDYRLTWIVMRIITWVCYLWMVYALTGAILGKLTGILKLSRRFLNAAFLMAIVAALLTARFEYQAVGGCVGCSGLERAVGIAFVVERVISTVALLAIIAMLAFMVFFPVRLPRNLVLFTAGYLVYFAAKTGILLARDWTRDRAVLSIVSMCLMSACFVYWLLTISEAGEAAPLTLRNMLRKGDEMRAVHQLEAMNLALLRAARH